jgi:hypothetical protein
MGDRCVYLFRVARWLKVLDAILRAVSDANIEFSDLYALLAGRAEAPAATQARGS